MRTRLILTQVALLFVILSLSHSLFAQESSICDPYRWLEDSESAGTQDWLTNQQQHFDRYKQSNTYREEIKKSLTRILNYDSYALPIRRGDHYFFKMRRAGDNQSILYVQKGIKGSPRVLLNPNELNTHSPVSLTAFVPSPDGRLLAYGLSESGSDWQTWQVLEIDSGKVLADRIEKIKFFPLVWHPQSKGFYYSREAVDHIFRIYYHELETSQESDAFVYENLDNPEYYVSPLMSTDHNYLLINVMKGSSGPNALLYRNLDQSEGPFRTLLPMNGANHNYVCNEGSLFYCFTDDDAPLGKVIAKDVASGETYAIIPESQQPLHDVVAEGNTLIAVFADHVISRLKLYDRLGNELREIASPGMGTIAIGENGNAWEKQESEIFFSFTHFFQPPVIYRYQIESDQLEIFKQPRLSFNPQEYQTKQAFFTSKDGTKVPLFIVHKKGLELDGNHDTLLYAYGGFSISTSPSFNPLHMAWLENGGVFALANIRGGGEYGKKWHEAGQRDKKQNCFDDFIGAAEWLIHNGYTHSRKLAIRGASNGGLLTAVCVNQRPDLFGAALVEVGVLDMLRFHLFTVGRFWMVEYGNPQNPEDCKVLSRYSPYHNIQKGVAYPPVLVTTGDHDDRVVPLHSYKYTAAMQEAHEGRSLVLLRVDRQGGHGAGKSTSQWIEEAADTLSFLKLELAK